MWKVVGSIAGVLILVGALGIVGEYLGVLGNAATLPARVANKVLTPDNAINSYDWFTDQFNQIKQGETAYKNDADQLADYEKLHGDASKWTFDVSQEDSRLRSMRQGAQNAYAQLVNDYNAKAAELDKNIFRDRSLPTHIDPDPSVTDNQS